MAADNPALLHYFLQDDLYLLPEDKSRYNLTAIQTGIEPQVESQQSTAVIEAVESASANIPFIPQVKETPKRVFNYLGNNKKNFLILVHYTTDEHMADAHFKALESTLGRKSLGLDDVAIVNVGKHQDHAHADYITFFSPDKLVILGRDAAPAGLTSTSLNTIENLEDRLQLFTHSFDEMINDQEKKKAFWEQMKTL